MDRKNISLSIVLLFMMSILISSVAFSEAEQSDKQKIVQRVAQNWVQVGKKQYEKGFYAQAEKSFLRALDYKNYLSVSSLDEINDLLSKVKASASENVDVTKDLQSAGQFWAEGKLLDAQKCFQKVKASANLPSDKVKYVDDSLKEIEVQIEQRKKFAASLYSTSVKVFDNGDYEKAREGFLKLSKEELFESEQGKSAEDYLAKIDAILVQRSGFPLSDTKKTEIVEVEDGLLADIASPSEKAEPGKSAVKEPEISVIEPLEASNEASSKPKMSIKESYSRAVVKNSVDTADRLVAEGRFYHAKKALTKAFSTLEENRSLIGEVLYGEYTKQLKLLSDKIASGSADWLGDAKEETK